MHHKHTALILLLATLVGLRILSLKEEVLTPNTPSEHPEVLTGLDAAAEDVEPGPRVPVRATKIPESTVETKARKTLKLESLTYLGIENGHARFKDARGRIREASSERMIVRVNREGSRLPEVIDLTPKNQAREIREIRRIAPELESLGLLDVDSRNYGNYLEARIEGGYTLKPDWVIRAPKPASIAPPRPASGDGGETPGDRWHYDVSGLDTYAAGITQAPEDPIIVAVVDTGIDITHPQLASQLYVNPDEIPGNGIDDDENGYIDDVHGWNFHDNDNDLSDSNFHGTHVAGIIGARELTAEELTSFPGTPAPASPAAPYVRIMPLKVFGPDHAGYTSDFVAAIRYARLNGADLINHSWGSPSYDWDVDDEINRSGLYEGILNIASAGNDSLDLDYAEAGWFGARNDAYPAELGYDWVYGVAAYEADRSLSDFSNYGSQIDTTAPGGLILSTTPLVLNAEALEIGVSPGSTQVAGTSMAAPCVSASLALLMAKNPFLKRQPDLVREFYLQNFHEDIGLPVANGRALSHPNEDPEALFVINPKPDRTGYTYWYPDTTRIRRHQDQPSFFFVETHRTGAAVKALPVNVVFSGDSAYAAIARLPDTIEFRVKQKKRVIAFEVDDYVEDSVIEPEMPFTVTVNSVGIEVYGLFKGVFPEEGDRYVVDVHTFDNRYRSDDSDGDGIIAVAEAAFGTDPNVADTSVGDHIDFGIHDYGFYMYNGDWHTTQTVAYVQLLLKQPGVELFPRFIDVDGEFVLEMSYDLVNWVTVPLRKYSFSEDDPLYGAGYVRMRYETNPYATQDPPFPIVPKRFFRFNYKPSPE